MNSMLLTLLFTLTTLPAFASQSWKVLITNKTGDKTLSLGLTAEVDSLLGGYTVIQYDSVGKGQFIADGFVLGGQLSLPITLPGEPVYLAGATLNIESKGFIRFFKINEYECLVTTKNLKSFRAKSENLPCGFFEEVGPPGGFTGSN